MLALASVALLLGGALTTEGNVTTRPESVVGFDLLEDQLEICRRKKFTPTFHNLQILGICDKCRQKGEQPDSPDRVKMIQEAAMTLRR